MKEIKKVKKCLKATNNIITPIFNEIINWKIISLFQKNQNIKKLKVLLVFPTIFIFYAV